MKNKMFMIVGVVLLLFGALYFVNMYKDNQALEKAESNVEDGGNPYGDKKLESSTVDLLNDPLYNKQVLPDDLRTEIESGDPVTVYFFSPECGHCIDTTPVLVPVTEDLDVDMVKLNLLEFPQEWEGFDIESTPTVVHYENNEEVARIIGSQKKEEFEVFFKEYVKK